jgi:lipoprotein-anchoring transpeptidase ErfK/SrfK
MRRPDCGNVSDTTVTRLLPVVFVVLALLAAGCGGGRTGGASGMNGVAGERKTLVPHCAAGTRRAVGRPGVAVAAVVTQPTTAYQEPGGRAVASFGLLNVNGVPTVFGVLGQRVDASCRPTWLHVQLPIRPNGATGWVRADHVETAKLRTRIVVDLSERRVRFYKRDRLVLSAVAAVGSSATPTPLGRYYVNQRLIPSERGGPFGPGAVGISAFSPVLTGWAQGGPIAIHGTNEPWSIGRAVSNGCIRLPNAVLLKLFRQTPSGTPVLIRQ